jgi:hypothetical protein
MKSYVTGPSTKCYFHGFLTMRSPHTWWNKINQQLWVSFWSAMVSRFCVRSTSKRWFLKIIQVTVKDDLHLTPCTNPCRLHIHFCVHLPKSSSHRVPSPLRSISTILAVESKEVGGFTTSHKVPSPKFQVWHGCLYGNTFWRWGLRLLLRFGSSKKLDPTLHTSPARIFYIK